MEEIAYLVCTRVDELEGPVEGSTTTACVECGSDIWISAESRKEMVKRKAMPLCSGCALRLAKETNVSAETIHMPSLSVEEDAFMGRLQKIVEEMESLNKGELDIFEEMKVTAGLAGEAMQHPQDEWGSMAIIQDYEGVRYPAVPISAMLDKGMPKEILARQILPAMMQAAHAKVVCLGLSTWMVRSDKPIPEGVMPSEHPDRIEAIFLIEMTADGVQRMATAEIVRDEISPPKLGEWREDVNQKEADGLFVEAIVPTLQLIRTLQGK